jgi:hypothetical protein
MSYRKFRSNQRKPAYNPNPPVMALTITAVTSPTCRPSHHPAAAQAQALSHPTMLLMTLFLKLAYTRHCPRQPTELRCQWALLHFVQGN